MDRLALLFLFCSSCLVIGSLATNQDVTDLEAAESQTAYYGQRILSGPSGQQNNWMEFSLPPSSRQGRQHGWRSPVNSRPQTRSQKFHSEDFNSGWSNNPHPQRNQKPVEQPQLQPDIFHFDFDVPWENSPARQNRHHFTQFQQPQPVRKPLDNPIKGPVPIRVAPPTQKQQVPLVMDIEIHNTKEQPVNSEESQEDLDSVNIPPFTFNVGVPSTSSVETSSSPNVETSDKETSEVEEDVEADIAVLVSSTVPSVWKLFPLLPPPTPPGKKIIGEHARPPAAHVPDTHRQSVSLSAASAFARSRPQLRDGISGALKQGQKQAPRPYRRRPVKPTTTMPPIATKEELPEIEVEDKEEKNDDKEMEEMKGDEKEEREDQKEEEKENDGREENKGKEGEREEDEREEREEKEEKVEEKEIVEENEEMKRENDEKVVKEEIDELEEVKKVQNEEVVDGSSVKLAEDEEKPKTTTTTSTTTELPTSTSTAPATTPTTTTVTATTTTITTTTTTTERPIIPASPKIKPSAKQSPEEIKSLLRNSESLSLSEVLQKKGMSLADLLKGGPSLLQQLRNPKQQSELEPEEDTTTPLSTTTSTTTTTTETPADLKNLPIGSIPQVKPIKLSDLLSTKNLSLSELLKPKELLPAPLNITSIFKNVYTPPVKSGNTFKPAVKRPAPFRPGSRKGLPHVQNRDPQDNDSGQQAEESDNTELREEQNIKEVFVPSNSANLPPLLFGGKAAIAETTTPATNTSASTTEATTSTTTTKQPTRSRRPYSPSNSVGEYGGYLHDDSEEDGNKTDTVLKRIVPYGGQRPIATSRLTPAPPKPQRPKYNYADSDFAEDELSWPDVHSRHSDNAPQSHFNEEDLKEETKFMDLPLSVKSAIIASSAIGGFCIIVFLAILVAFKCRQKTRIRFRHPAILFGSTIAGSSVAGAGSDSSGVATPVTSPKGGYAKLPYRSSGLWGTLRRTLRQIDSH